MKIYEDVPQNLYYIHWIKPSDLKTAMKILQARTKCSICVCSFFNNHIVVTVTKNSISFGYVFNRCFTCFGGRIEVFTDHVNEFKVRKNSNRFSEYTSFYSLHIFHYR